MGIGHGFGAIDDDVVASVAAAMRDGQLDPDAIVAEEERRAARRTKATRQRPRKRRGQRPGATAYEHVGSQVRNGLEKFNRVAARARLRSRWDPIEPLYSAARARGETPDLTTVAVVVVTATAGGHRWTLLRNPPSMRRVNHWRPSARDGYNVLYTDRVRSFESSEQVLTHMTSWPVPGIAIRGPDIVVEQPETGHRYVFRFGSLRVADALPEPRWGWQWVRSTDLDLPPDQVAALTSARSRRRGIDFVPAADDATQDRDDVHLTRP